jgi:hypothetical protein
LSSRETRAAVAPFPNDGRHFTIVSILCGLFSDGNYYNTHGHQLRFTPSEKAQFVTALSIMNQIIAVHIVIKEPK